MKRIKNWSFNKLAGLALLLVFGCTKQQGTWGVSETFDGQKVDLNKSKSNATALMVLSPDCPLCIAGSRDFQDLKDSFENQGIDFYGLVPGMWYQEDEVAHFKDSVGFKIPILKDENFNWSKHLEAEVTPHYFLLDSTLQVVYSGPMDDRVMRLGKKRIQATELFYKNAIVSYLSGNGTSEYIKPTGCVIEYE